MMQIFNFKKSSKWEHKSSNRQCYIFAAQNRQNEDKSSNLAAVITNAKNFSCTNSFIELLFVISELNLSLNIIYENFTKKNLQPWTRILTVKNMTHKLDRNACLYAYTNTPVCVTNKA